MELQNVIEKRRSIRRYTTDEVPMEDVRACIEAGILAPSWKNSQTARYHVVTSKEKLAEVKKMGLPEFNANNVENAPVLIVMSFVSNRSGFEKDGTPTNELENGWGAYDLGLATQNMILKATELGYGTLIMGIRDEAKLRELLDIDEKETIVSVIGLGKGDIEPTMPKRKSVEDVSTFK